MIFSDDKMCSSSFHTRSLNGLVDPLSFTAINFLRNYNRLISPNDVAQCYNLSLLKDSRVPRNLLHPAIPPIPLQTIIASAQNETVLPINHIDHNFQSNRPIPSPLSRVVSSSTCPPSPSTDPDDSKHPSQFSLSQNFDQNSLDGTSLSPGFIRRQRGEKRPIPDEQKDEKYYERRKRNNEAAKKSRDARKLREDRIAFRAAILEQENAILRTQVLALRDEVGTLRQLLCSRN